MRHGLTGARVDASAGQQQTKGYERRKKGTQYQLSDEEVLLRVLEVLVETDDVAVVDLLHDLDLLLQAL